jgi:flavin-dependent dehydrogenase
MILSNRALRTRVAFPARDSLLWYSISRRDLDAALAEEAVRRGARVVAGARVVGSRLEDDSRILQVRDEEGATHEIRAEIVLACDGLGSVTARHAGLVEKPLPLLRPKIGVSAQLQSDAFDCPPQWITMTFHRDGYAGIVGVRAKEHSQSHMWNAAAAIVPEALRAHGGPWKAVLHLLCENGISTTNAGVDPINVATCPVLARRINRPWAPRLLLAGDAAGYVEPFTGEGMAWALSAAWEAAELAASGWTESTGPAYESAWRRLVGSRRRAATIAALILDSPLAGAGVLAVLRLIPKLGSVTARHLAQPSHPVRSP